MRQRGSDHRHEGRGPRRAERGRAAADELRPLDALRLQRLAGNRALAGVIGSARRAERTRTAPISALVQRAVPTDTAPAPAAAATDEQALVRQWSTEAGANENTLTDRLYFHRHPELQGVALKPGTPGVAEWIEIRETVVRPPSPPRRPRRRSRPSQRRRRSPRKPGTAPGPRPAAGRGAGRRRSDRLGGGDRRLDDRRGGGLPRGRPRGGRGRRHPTARGCRRRSPGVDPACGIRRTGTPARRCL
jgi:hypothetical protein